MKAFSCWKKQPHFSFDGCRCKIQCTRLLAVGAETINVKAVESFYETEQIKLLIL